MSGDLAGLRVLVTRAAHQTSGLADLLVAAGAEVIALPVLALGPPPDGGAALRRAAAQVREFAWIVFSSTNAVDAFVAALSGGFPAPGPGAPRIAAIGPATAEALVRRGISIDLAPERAIGEALVDAFPRSAPGASRRVLVPRALVARDVVPDGLAALGWDVEVVAAYETLQPAVCEPDLAAVARADVVTFTSSSSVTGFLEVAGAGRLPHLVASIGPVTSATARDAGIDVDVEADEHTTAGLVAALCDFVGARRRAAGPGAVPPGGAPADPVLG